MKTAILAGGALALALGTAALAQQTETTTVVKERPSGTAAGAATGAVTGAAVAGPVGAVAGAVVGGAVGTVVAPPTEVRTYVTRQNVPAVTYGHPVVVGHPIEGTVTWLDIPSYPKYHWAYLDGHRVVVDSDTHEVVAIY